MQPCQLSDLQCAQCTFVAPKPPPQSVQMRRGWQVGVYSSQVEEQGQAQMKGWLSDDQDAEMKVGFHEYIM